MVRGRQHPLMLTRLYAIVDAETLAAREIELRHFAEQLRDGGVTLVQYRDKLGSREEILRNAKVIGEVFRNVACMLVMNDDPALALEAGWNAVHVGQGDASVGEARIMLGREAVVGCSTNNDEQVIAANVAGADYIAIGPVFATPTKADAEPVVGLEGVRRARALTRRPLVAIGGITEKNAASVIDAGADSVAVIGALLKPGDQTGEIVKWFLAAMPA